nr:hypothetical protein [Mycolicibacterium hodleri]
MVVLLVVVKLWSVVIAGGSAASDFAERNSGALRGDVDTLDVLNVIEPAKALVAAGSLAVLEDRLEDADGLFAEALDRSDPARSCAIRIDLEFVRETLGDRSSTALDGASAASWYRRALAVVESAPQGCFRGSTDIDEQRRALLDAAAARLAAKLATAFAVPAAPPPPPVAPPPPPPPPPSSSNTRIDEGGPLRLNPDTGDPLERLQQILRDAAAAQNGG